MEIPSMTRWVLWQQLMMVSVAVGLAVLCWASPAIAAAQIRLQYRDQHLIIAPAELHTLAQTGEPSPTLAQFFSQIPLTPAQVRELLNSTMLPSGKIKLDQQTLDFLTLQINKLVGTPFRQEPTAPLRTTIAAAIQDDRAFSLLEIIDRYPDPQIRLELANLERVGRDVKLLVERLYPLLTLVQPLLPELLCECGQDLWGRNEERTTELSHVWPNQPSPTNTALVRGKALAPSLKTLPWLPQRSATANSLPSLSLAPPPKQVTFTFGALTQSLAIQDLTTFVATGQPSSALRFILKLAKLPPADFKTLLTQTITADLQFLDTILNSLLGEYALFQLGQVLHTQSRQANIQALRSTLILAARDDNQISPLEFLQNYPTQTLYIDGIRLAHIARTAKRISAAGTEHVVGSLLDEIEEWLVALQASAAEVVCDCPPAS